MGNQRKTALTAVAVMASALSVAATHDWENPAVNSRALAQMGGCPQAAVLTGKKIGIIIRNNPQKRRKEKPSYDERSSTGKAGCGKSARTV